MFDSLTLFSKQRPPENVDLFVLGNRTQAGPMVYGIMRFFRKGTRLPMPYAENAYLGEERILDTVTELEEYTAQQDGYYFLDHLTEEKFIWLLSCIDPADSAYGVVGSADTVAR